MAHISTNKPGAHITNSRIRIEEDRDLIRAELAKDIWSTDQRLELLKELSKLDNSLAALHEMQSKRWRRRYEKQKGKPYRKYKRKRPDYIEPTAEELESEAIEDSKLKFIDSLDIPLNGKD